LTENSTSRHYTIGEAVAELQRVYPDVTHSSLRFLERDGLLKPDRTPGGHRLYRTQDLDRVRTIKAWQAERLSLEEIRQRIARLESSSGHEELWRRFLELGLAGRFHEAAAVVLGADEIGFPLAAIFQDILTPALFEVGRRWANDAVIVGQEHEVTEMCRDLISELTMRHMGHNAQGPAVVAAAIENEMHDLGLRMICGLLRQGGSQVHFLGSNVSTSILMESVRLRRPDVVLLSATLDQHFPMLESAVRCLRSSSHRETAPVVLIGGRGDTRTSDVLNDPGVSVVGPGTLTDAVDEIMRLWQGV